MDPQTLPAPDNATLVHDYQPQPGVYAVSVNFLAGFLFPQGYEDYLGYFAGTLPAAGPGIRF
jgi:hypothetical protein